MGLFDAQHERDSPWRIGFLLLYLFMYYSDLFQPTPLEV